MQKAFVQLHIAVFLAGFTAVLGKLIGLNEGLLVWYRLLITVIILWWIGYLKKSLQLIAFQDLLTIFAVGLLVAIHWVTFYGSVKYGNASIALVSLSAAGFFTAFFEPFFFKRKVQLVDILLSLVSIAGIAIIFDFHPQYKIGIIFGIVSAMGFSLSPIFNKKLLIRFSPATLLLYELVGGLIGTTLLIPFYLRWFPAPYYLPTATDWWWLLVLAGICTVLCFDLQLNALQKISPFTANIAYNLEPAYGIVLAFVVFKENQLLDVHFYIGLTLIILSVVLQTARVWLANRNGLPRDLATKP